MFRRLSVALVLAVLLFSVSVAGASALPDVEGHWAESEIRQLVGQGAISGYPDGTYKPENTITRAEFSSVLCGALGLDEAEGATFLDIDDHWARGRIEALIQEGIINTALYDEQYGPDDPITREEIAMMTVRMVDTNQAVSEMPFDDVDEISQGYEEYIARAYSKGIVTGYQDDTVRPGGTATRAEAAVMAVRALTEADLLEEEVGELALHFIDVGQGDAILVGTPCELYFLVDAGTKGAGDTVVSYLKELGVDRLKKVVATHDHADHAGGLISVYESPIEVVTTYVSPYEHDTQTAEEFRTLAEAHSTLKTPSVLDTLNLKCEHIEATFMHPYTSAAGDIHYMNLVLNVAYEDFSALLTGDAEIESEQAMLDNHEVRAYLPSEVLKVGHHGSRTSTGEAFLEKVSPEVAVIQVGEDNRYGHPHQEVLDRLNAAGMEIYRTDISGNIVIYSDGIGYDVQAEPYKPDPAEPEPEPVGRIDVNSASLEELQEIIHIGESRAEEIMDLRPFNSLDELTRVTGIGDARLADIIEEGKAYVE